MWRDELRPVGSPRQKGELADRATSSARCPINALTTWIAFSGSSTATCTWRPKISPRLELVARHRGEHRVDVLDEVECLAVEQHVLLLDAERVRIAASEGVVEHAASLCESAALAGDRRRMDLLHSGISASASISTSQLGSRSAAT